MTKVMIGYADGGKVDSEFSICVADLMWFELKNPTSAYEILPFQHAKDIYPPENRNRLVRKAFDLGADWLLQIDPDETFAPHTLRIMMRTAHELTRPVVTGHYANIANMDFDGNGAFTVCDMVFEEGENGMYRNVIPSGDMQPFPVAACGTGMFLTHMSVYNQIPYPWYELAYFKSSEQDELQPMNEDIDFCRKLRMAGYEIWCDPMAEVTHWKTVPLKPSTTRKWLEESMKESDALRADQKERAGIGRKIRSLFEVE
jgi:hypothetical protein